ncbi:unnamed protein product [Polarella glacialis]|uniref:Uncharacterized protein n=1 Tax=Polarella glacialis TaxID=89957 RepID=A0A813K195_POLGL|nr:unnamed protein product [Polarella glacialis]
MWPARNGASSLHAICSLLMLSWLCTMVPFTSFVGQPKTCTEAWLGRFRAERSKVALGPIAGLRLYGRIVTRPEDLQALVDLAEQQEKEAEKDGRHFISKLETLRKPRELIHFAETHGAEVKAAAKSAQGACVRIEKGGVSFDIKTSGRKDEFRDSVMKWIIISFKAMGIAFGTK